MLLLSKSAWLLCLISLLLVIKTNGQTSVSGPQSGTWTKEGSPYIISSSVTVGEGKTLIIQSGVEVHSVNYADKFTINGTLIAKGTQNDLVRFTGFGLENSNLYTHGGSLTFSSTSVNSVLENVSINQMGDTQYSQGAIIVSSSSLTISHCTITNNEAPGIYIDGLAKPVIKDNSFTKDLIAIDGSANNFDQVTNNSVARITIRTDAVNSNSVLPKQATGSYYVLKGGFSVNAQKTLEIKPGVEIHSENYSDRITINGTLIAKGTQTNLIRFTGFALENSNLYTHGGSLYFSGTSVNSVLENVSFDQMGDNQYTQGAIIVSSSSLTISHCTITNNEAPGINIDGLAKPIIQDNNFTRNLVAIEGSANNFDQVSNNSAARIHIRTDAVNSNSILPKQAAESYYVLKGGFSINAQTTFEIKPGVEIRSENYSDRIIINGTLIAKGTQDETIRFTGFALENSTLYTHGGSLSFSSTSVNSVLDYVSIDRMGDSQYAQGALVNSSSSISIDHCSIFNSETNGIYNDGPALQITNTNLYNNQAGLYSTNGTVVLTDCKIYDNTEYGIYNRGTEPVDARNNYWGVTSGPLHPTLNADGKGNPVSDKVLFVPWKQQLIRVEQSITMPAIADQYVGGMLKLNATASSGLPLTYQISSTPKPGIASLSGDILSFAADTGVVTLTISQAGNTSFLPAELKTSFKVLNQILAVNLSAKQVTEGSADGITVTVSRNASLTEELALTIKVGNGKRLTVPAAITIPAGQAGVTFRVTVPENDKIEGNITDSITVSAVNYKSALAIVSILDNEVPALSITDLPAEGMEGKTIVFHINTNFTPQNQITVFLRTGNQTRFPLPASVVIPAGASTIAVSVTLVQDAIPEIDLPVTLSASAANHQPATAEIKVTDDDLPDFELLFNTNTITESAGPYAAKATLRRKSQEQKTAFTVNLSADIPGTLILPASITLTAAENEKTFDIGVIDNDLVDGSRELTISASMFVASCGCSTPPASAGSVVSKITISDNDGPSLQLSTAQQTLPEGLTNAGMLRITRNTPNNIDLAIALTSSDTNEAIVPASVVIPSGKSFVEVPIATKNDGIEDGSKQVYFQATANGFSTGTTWVLVTDINKADLQIAEVKVNKESVQALTVFNYELGIKNTGFATAAGGVVVKGYLSLDNTIDSSDILIAEDTVKGPIPAGETKLVLNAVKIPQRTGAYKLLFWVNPEEKLTELLYTNNISAGLNLAVTAKYTAKAEVAQAHFLKGVTIPVKGTATTSDGTLVINEKVDVYIIVNGIKRVIPVTTDATGKFSADFLPLANEAGHYIVGACYPGLGISTEQDAFDILGVRINEGIAPQFLVKLGATQNGTIKVENASAKDLTSFSLTPVKLPHGGTLTFNTVALLKGNSSIQVPYTLKGTALSPGDNYEEISLQVKTAEGNIQLADAYYYCQASNANLIANVELLDVKASQSKGEREISFKLINKGQGATGKVQINLPDVKWISAVSPKILPDLGAGDTAIVALKFLAVADIPFDFPVKGNIGIAAQNGNSFLLPFIFKKVAEAAGTVVVTATDQFTYYTEGGPNLKDAQVQIKNAYTGELYATGNTDANGIFTAKNVPEGRHMIIVKKDKHKDYTGEVEVNPGSQIDLSAFLSYQAITFDWKVVPTGIQDKYDITLETKFETNVPMPVVTIDMPKVMPQLVGNQLYSFNITLTNHGLITADKVQLTLPSNDDEYEFITNYEPADLASHQTIQVPVVMRRRQSSSSRMAMGLLAKDASPAGAPTCKPIVLGAYRYKCNLVTGVWETISFPYEYANRNCDNNGGGGGGNGGGGLSASQLALIDWWFQWMNGYGNGTKGIPCVLCGPPEIKDPNAKPYVPPKWMTEKKNCIDCYEAVGKAFTDLLGLPDLTKLGLCYAKVYQTTGASKDYATCLAGMVGESVKDIVLDKIIEDASLDAGLIEEVPLELYELPSFRKSEITGNDIAKKVIGPTPLGKAAFFAADLAGALNTCIRSFTNPKPPESRLAKSAGGIHEELAANLASVASVYQLRLKWQKEYFGNMSASDDWVILFPLLEDHINQLTPFDNASQLEIISAMKGYTLSEQAIQSFFTRWNTSLTAADLDILSPNSQYPNIINWDKIKSYSDSLVIAHNQSIDKNFESVDDMLRKSLISIHELINSTKNDVCASVTVQFNQQLAMTREAFEGTLEILNGHPSEGMKQLAVDIQITDNKGILANGLFEIQTKSLINLSDVTGSGEIAAQEKGEVQFVFIPELGAAPKEPQVYQFGGTVTYWDPYAQAIVKLPLSPVPLTVNPSPNLMLHYFMQRNILGDDALTSPEIEPSIPAELSVMVENQGYGPAVNMTISSSQPKIIDNEKGLDVDFELIASNFQGQPKKMGVTNINFGTIPALQTRIGQWYFTSSLLGKFVSYEAKVVHASSLGNPDLSLVRDVKLHELTKSIRLYGDDEDGIGDFLVNDIFDINDQPDIIYFSQGYRTAKVNAAKSGSFSAAVQPPSFVNQLTVVPADTGFNYIKLDDPGNKLYELVSVTRNDGQLMPVENSWLTFVTLPVSHSPVYENKFHFVDHFKGVEPVNYTVVWKPKSLNTLKVDSIYDAPLLTSVVQVKKLKVVFNKNVDPASFTIDDLNLTLQGGPNLINSNVKLSQVDTSSFEIDLSAVTTGNGLYLFTVQAAEITDRYGIKGTTGKQVSWSQFIDLPAVEAFSGIPESHVASKFDGIGVLFNLPIDITTVTPARFTLKKDGNTLPGSLVIESISNDHKLFNLSGLKDLLVQNGKYELVVDLPNIKAESQKAGLSTQSVTLTVDNTGPGLISLTPTAIGGIDNQHIPYVNMEFDEDAIDFNITSIKLTRNGEVLPLRIDQLSNTDLKTWSAGNFGLLTYPDGNYTLQVDLTGIKDIGGNAGIGSKSVSWVVDRSSTIAISKLAVKPDLGYAADDGITSGTSMTVSFHLDNPAEKVILSQTDKSGEAILTTINDVAAGDVTLPITLLPGGSIGIKVSVIDKNGIRTSQEKSLFIDRTALTGKWTIAADQVLDRQPETLDIVFSSALLDPKLVLPVLEFSRNGVVLLKDNLRAMAVNDTVYQVTGLQAQSSTEGNYQVRLDTRLLSKYSSGKTGDGMVIANWKVTFPNQAPVADAGEDIMVSSAGLVELDGSRSSDPDNNAITYNWTAPDGIVLKNANTAKPSFTATMNQNGKTFPFLLVVSDGKLFHTAAVNVTMNYPPLVFPVIPEKSYADADFEISATSGQGTVSYTLGGEGILSIDKNKIHIIKAGTTVINATDGKTTISQTLIIKKAELKVTALDLVRNYGAPNPEFKLVYEGFVKGDDLTKLIVAPVASSTVNSQTAAGSYPITVSGGSSDNYSFNYIAGKIIINKIGQTITFNTLPGKVYGDPIIDLTAIATSGLPVSYTSSAPDIAVILGTNQVKILKAGSVIITAQQSGNLNYSAATDVAQTLTITKAALTFKADDKSRPYFTENPAFTSTYSGFVNGDDPSKLQRPPQITTTAVSNSNTGIYPITISDALSDSYTISYVNGNMTIVKAVQTIDFQDIPLLRRRGDVYALEVKSSSGLPVQLTLRETLVATLNGTLLTPLRIGTGKVTAEQSGNENYLPASSVIKDFRVTDDNNAAVRVHPAVSPDGDGLNDFLTIEGVADYPDNHVTVVTRNGVKVFETSGYNNKNNVFTGKNTNGNNLPQGTYFYILEYKANGKMQRQTGYFVVKY